MQPPSKPLWLRIQEFSFDESGADFPFTERLARDNGWSLAFTRRVVEEYRRFAFLALTAGHPVTPSDSVDQAWHLHLLYTESYWQRFCRDTLGKPLHHHPTRGGPRERAKFRDWYQQTLSSYRQLFGEEPPADIWPDGARRFGEDIRFVRVNTHRHWTVPKPRWWLAVVPLLHRLATISPLRMLGTVLALTLPTVVAGCGVPLLSRTPMDGPSFLAMAFGLWLVIHGLAAAWRMWLCKPAPEAAKMSEESPDPYVVAYLAHGAAHTIDTALMSLAHQGTVVANPNSRNWKRTGPVPPTAHPWEQLVYRNFCEEGETSVQGLEERLEPALKRLRTDLEEKGFLVDPRNSLRARQLPTLLASSVPILIGLRILHGLENEKPIGGLIILGVVTVVSTLAFLSPPHRSQRGSAILSEWQQKHPRPAAPCDTAKETSAPSVLALAVGLYGLGVLDGTPLEISRKVLQQERTANASSSAGGCGDGGCGGGCGGCGGCG